MKLLRNASLLILALGLSACSSSKVVRVPAELMQLDSPLQLERNWQVSLNTMHGFAAKGLAIAHDDQHVYVADSDGMVSAMIKQNQSRWTDQVVWQIKLAERIVSGPVLDNGQLIVGTAKGKLLAIDREQGALLWQTQLSSEVLSQPVVAGNKVFTRTVDGHLYALDSKNGQTVWVTENPVPTLSLRGVAPVLFDQGVIYVGWETGKVEAVSADSGNTLWESRVAIPRGRTDLERMVDLQAALVLHQGALIALGYHGKLVAMNPQTGNLYYSKDLSGYRDFVVDDKAVYAVDEDDVIHAYDLSNGTKLWSQVGLKYRNLADLYEHNQQLLAIDGLGYLHWLDKVHGSMSARARHSNDYGDSDTVVRLLVDRDTLYLLDAQGGFNSYQVTASNLARFQSAASSATE